MSGEECQREEEQADGDHCGCTAAGIVAEYAEGDYPLDILERGSLPSAPLESTVPIHRARVLDEAHLHFRSVTAGGDAALSARSKCEWGSAMQLRRTRHRAKRRPKIAE